MIEQDFISQPYNNAIPNGCITWESPSNIALIKYWGKKEEQIPENPSLSFTLNICKTTTSLKYKKKHREDGLLTFDFYFERQLKEDFKPKTQTFFERIERYLPFLRDYHFIIETSNSFPHSSGIASSASGMSALALCLMSLENALNPKITNNYFNRKASFLARLGSGSACRSIEGNIIVWGKHDAIGGSSNLFGIKYPDQVHENFKNYKDTILLVDKGTKQVSSTVGHDLMHRHPFAQERFKQAHDSINKLKPVLKTGNLKAFIAIIESEALTLHAMMMTSKPYFILMKPNTISIINKIWKFRQATGLNIGFTLDAGANVHVLYPQQEAAQIYKFIKENLVMHCQNGHFICDEIGFGAKQI